MRFLPIATLGFLSIGTVQAGAEQNAAPVIGLAQYLQIGYAGVKADLSDAAAKMPPSEYGFVPSEMPEVRTFGQIFTHVAAAQFGACAAMTGEPDPTAGRDLERELETKSEVVAILAESFAFCDEAIASLTETNVSELVRQGRREIARGAAVVGLLAHGAEMYGISTVYLRAKNLVPPSTERQLQRQRGR